MSLELLNKRCSVVIANKISDKNNQLKLNEIIFFINRVLLTILHLRNQRLVV